MITQKQIAEKLNVSTATVSLALSDNPGRISKKMVHLVRSTANEMGYIPNRSARKLRTEQSRSIGLLIPNISNTFFSEVAQKIIDLAYENNYSVVIGASNNNIEQDHRYVQAFISQALTGCCTHRRYMKQKAYLPIIDLIKKIRCRPCLLTGNTRLRYPGVYCDNTNAAFLVRTSDQLRA